MLTNHQLATLLVAQGFRRVADSQEDQDNPEVGPWCYPLDNWGLHYGIGRISSQISFATAKQHAQIPHAYPKPGHIIVHHITDPDLIGDSCDGTIYDGNNPKAGPRIVRHLLRLIATGRKLQARHDAQDDLMAQLMAELQLLLPKAVKLTVSNGWWRQTNNLNSGERGQTNGLKYASACHVEHARMYTSINLVGDIFWVLARPVQLADPDCLLTIANIITGYLRGEYSKKLATARKRVAILDELLSQVS